MRRVARLGATLEHRRPRGGDHRDRAGPAGGAGAADRRGAPAPAGALGDQGRRRARLPARAPGRELRDARADRDRALASASSGAREGPRAPRRRIEIECGSGTYVRSLIADLGDAYCLELRRTAIGPFEVAEAIAPPPRGASWVATPPADPALARCSSSRSRAGASIACGAVKVTRLPDVERGAPRSVAVGTFDGVHLGHREVIAGLRQRADVRPASRSRSSPRSTRRSC